MAFVFIHLSDIHFGQEKGGSLFVNDDVKAQLLEDARKQIFNLPNQRADGIIISGDIAYAGKVSEYVSAGKWLDRLASAVGCDQLAVQVVPGNHDIDRSQITNAVQDLIENIIQGGDSALDRYMEKEGDREFLYKQFGAYRNFAEAYDCPLDKDAVVLKPKRFELAPGRTIEFHGVNTALICSKSKKEEGGLLLGKRQRVLSVEPGVEIVVIAHHPLRWLQDSDDAMKYIKNRARVFVSGHEHKPAHSVEKIDNETDLLMLASGATVPPEATEDYTYCYNILTFDWESENDALKVTISARIWNDEKKAFSPDCIYFDNGYVEYILQCPNFKKLAVPCTSSTSDKQKIESKDVLVSEVLESRPIESHLMAEKQNQQILFRFFRELNSAQRLSILVDLGAISADAAEQLSHALERRALDALFTQNKAEEIEKSINDFLLPKIGDKDHD